jgi:mannan endo-1,4-beta-mannosidase
LLERVNTFDGYRYGDHPAVLAWELLNEPRNRGLDARGDTLRAWIDEVGAAVKGRTTRPVSTGEEGLLADAYDPALPGAGHFRRHLESTAVDFGSVHFFPEAWGIAPEQTARAGALWLGQHMAAARQAGKPLLLGELGLRNDGVFSLAERRAMIRGWLRCARRAGLAGAGLWMFAYDGRPDAWDRHTFYFRDGTEAGDPVNRYADLVQEAAAP